MGSEKGGEGGGVINWAKKREERNKPKVEIPPEIVESNRRGAVERMEKRAEANRQKLLDSIDPELLAITRTKAEKMVDAADPLLQVEAAGEIDTIVKSVHPHSMVASIHATRLPPERVGKLTATEVGTALAFLALTEEEKPTDRG